MIKSYICDRCHKEFHITRNGYGICEVDERHNISKPLQLCLDCQQSLLNWVKAFDPYYQARIDMLAPQYKDENSFEREIARMKEQKKTIEELWSKNIAMADKRIKKPKKERGNKE